MNEHQGEEQQFLFDDTGSQRSESTIVEWTEEEQFSGSISIYAIATCKHFLHPRHLFDLVASSCYCFIPQLIRSYVWRDYAPGGKEFSTSYLNGLRGLTAVKVFTFHYFMVFTDATHVPYGANGRYTYWTELPIIRYAWTGFTSHIFFCLAGYLTCQRIFVLMDRNDQQSQAKVLLSISGSVFRRALRLYLPVFLITLLTTTYIHLGWYESNRPLLLDWQRLFPGDWNETKPPMFDTWYEQLQFWVSEMYQICNFVSSKTVYPLHDQHLWSILAEWRASLHLYGCLIALTQVKRNVRLICLCGLVVAYFWWNHWEIWVYLLGAVVAQIDQILTESESARSGFPPQSHTTPASPVTHSDIEKQKDSVRARVTSGSQKRPPSIQEQFRTTYDKTYEELTCNEHIVSAYRFVGFTLAFYLLSYPIHGSRGDLAPYYTTLNRYIPEWMDRKDKFYANWGSFVLILLLVRSKPGKSRWYALMSHWLPQYLGSISFGFYLVQEIVMHSFGYLIPHHIWWSFGVEGIKASNGPWLSAILVGWAITLLATLWIADCWTREVESRCIRLVKWFEEICFR